MTGAVNNNLGFSSQLSLNVDQKTGKMTGAADMFSRPIEELYNKQMKLVEVKEGDKKKIDTKLEALANLELMATDLRNKSANLFSSNTMSEVTGKYGVFSNLMANYSSTSQTPVGALIDLNLGANSNLQQFTIEVDQIASYDGTMSTVGVADPAAKLNWTGNFTLNGQTLAVTADMSLTDISNALNRLSSDTDVKVSVVRVANNDFRLNLQGKTVGTPITIASTITGATNGQVPAASGNTVDSLSAKFKFNGVSMVRPTNNVEDVVKGLTLVLKKAEVGTVMTVQITPDADSVKTAIQDWVKSVNTLTDELAKHKVFDKKTFEPDENAVLFNTDIVASVEGLLRDNLAWSVLGNGDYKYLEKIGLTIDVKTRKMNIDEQLLDQAVKSNFESVQALFEYSETVANSKFAITHHPAQISNNIIADKDGNPYINTLTLSKDANGKLSAQITINAGPYTGQTFILANSPTKEDVIKVSGDNASIIVGDIPGASDNPFKGFQFIYMGVNEIANSTSVSTTFQVSQGFGDRFSKTLSQSISDRDYSDFSLQKSKFKDKLQQLDEVIENITKKADRQKEQQMREFAILEAFRQKVAPIQGMLDVIMNSMTNKS